MKTGFIHWFTALLVPLTILYTVDAVKLGDLAAVPFSLEGNACALHRCDPVSGLYIVTNLASNTWWMFDIMTDTWAQITGLTGKPDFGTACGGNGNNQFQVVIPEYGVIIYVDHNTIPLSVYLYKHANFTSVTHKVPDQHRTEFSLQVTRSSLGPNPVISWTGAASRVNADLFNLDGRLIKSFSGNKNPMTLQINGLAGMTFLLKVSMENETFYRKVFLRQ